VASVFCRSRAWIRLILLPGISAGMPRSIAPAKGATPLSAARRGQRTDGQAHSFTRRGSAVRATSRSLIRRAPSAAPSPASCNAGCASRTSSIGPPLGEPGAGRHDSTPAKGSVAGVHGRHQRRTALPIQLTDQRPRRVLKQFQVGRDHAGLAVAPRPIARRLAPGPRHAGLCGLDCKSHHDRRPERKFDSFRELGQATLTALSGKSPEA
jgi:hypothetical protein